MAISVIRLGFRVFNWLLARGFFRELEKVLGCTRASRKVKTPVECADGLGESCRTRRPLV